MPRLPWRLLRAAWKENPCLPSLLQESRDLSTARRELRWLKEHAQRMSPWTWSSTLYGYCRERARGKPLQYILGTELFSGLELQCRPGVLIPRPETAAYVTHLTKLLKKNAESLPQKLRVLDLCTGTGCIPLLFAYLFGGQHLQVLGVDISKKAIDLAAVNKREQSALHPGSSIGEVQFLRADIMAPGSVAALPTLQSGLKELGLLEWDILVSNPPYVSPKEFQSTTQRSVRNYEPKLALVPEAKKTAVSDHEHGDLFYPRLLDIAKELNVRMLLVEVGDLDQARRVAGYAQATGQWDRIEIWRDDPSSTGIAQEQLNSFPISGLGNGRSVLCLRMDGANWVVKR